MKKLFTNFYGLIIICSISLFSSQKALTQEHGIYELSTGNDSSITNNLVNREPLYDLAFNLHPTMYLKNGLIDNVYGDGEIKRLSIEDANSFVLLRNQDVRYDNVELVIVMLRTESDINNMLDITGDDVFGKLKYVYVKCYVDFKKEDIEKFIKVNNNVRVFYKLVNPS